MRKLLAMVMFAALFALTLAAGKGPGPKATGDASWDNPNGFSVHAVFDAQTKNGDAKGNVEITVSGTKNFSYTGTVECYEQSDNTATFSGSIDESAGFDNSGGSSHFVVTVVDNGEGANADADKIATNRTGDTDCDDPLDPSNEVSEGNIQVHRQPS